MAYKARLAGVTLPQTAGAVIHDRTGAQQVRPEARSVFNSAGADAPLGGILWMQGGLDTTSGNPQFQQPAYPGIAQIDIAAGIIPQGMSGLAVHVGRPTVLLKPGLTVNPGDRLGICANQWYAVLDQLGPMTVIGIAPQAGYAQVDLHRRRGDGIFVVDPAGVNSGFYDAWVCGSDVTLAAAAGGTPGDFTGLSA